VIRTKGVRHVELTVRDLDEAAGFYVDVFGFEIVGRRHCAAVLETPGVEGALLLREVASPADIRITDFGLALHDPGDLDAAVALAVFHGGTLVRLVEHPVGGMSALLTDRTGHRIAL
jgi:predicted enzyme related to lactoylglutathione lyase